MNYVFSDLMSDHVFEEKLAPFKYKPLPATGAEKGRLRNNYRAALRFFTDQVEKEGLSRLKALFKCLLEQMSVVQIDVWDPTNGPKIFDSLNSHQEPMTTGDLVRNEIFAKVANQHPDTIESIDQRSWQPFYNKFKQDDASLFDSYFFPYGLTQDPNLRKSEVYNKLRARWRDINDPEVIVKQLAEYQDAFLDVVRGSNLQSHPKPVHRAFLLLHESDAPSSTYPFLMQLSNALKAGTLDSDVGVGILSVIEAFLIRRAVCGHEPTGLHAVFKRLWNDCDGNYAVENVIANIKRHKTVAWPSDEDVRAAVMSRPLYGSAVVPFILKEWNRSLGGDSPQIKPWIEHVLPEKPSDDWLLVFSREQHEKMKDLLANLLPLSPEMNQRLGNGSYLEKRPVYSEDSGFKAARKFAEDYTEWTPSDLSERSNRLATWAVTRWTG